MGYSGSTRDYGKSLQGGDPVSAANGAYHFQLPLLAPGGIMGLSLELMYRSDYARSAPMLIEKFWYRPLAMAQLNYTIDSDVYSTVYLPNGDHVAFKKNASGEWELTGPSVVFFGYVYNDNRPQIKYVLKTTTDYAYFMDPVNGLVYIFKDPTFDRIERIIDRNGNQLIYSYTALPGHPVRVEDGLGYSLDFTYQALAIGLPYFLKTATDQSGRSIQFTYEVSGADNDNKLTLRSVTDALGQTTTFNYGGKVGTIWGLITGQTLPRGNTPFTQTYELKNFFNNNNLPRVTSQGDAYANTRNLSYDNAASILTAIEPDGAALKYKHYSTHGLPQSLADPTNKTAQFTKDVDEHLTGVTDRLGDTTTLTYHPPTGMLASVTNAEGRTLTHTYTAQNQTFTNPLNAETVDFTFYNRTRTDYPDGTNEQYIYDTKGNVLTKVDQAGKTWTYTYNARGQVLTAANPTGGILTNTFNADATRATTTDSEGVSKTFTYDAYKRPQRITHADGKYIEIGYDLNDQITSVRDENGNTYTYAYDVNGNLTAVTDPAANNATYAYDLMDRVTGITDKLNKTTTFTYNNRDRLQSVTDPNNLAAAYTYNTRNWLTGTTFGGQTWQTNHDDEGIPSSRTTPLNHTTTYQTDKLGYLTGLTNPLGQTTTLARDSLSRITGITDPLGRTINYTYDGRGFLSSVTMPVVGTATYTRNNLGLLNQITDLNGQNWTFGYTNIGRWSSTTDPLSRTTNYGYDNRGRVTAITYPNATAQTMTYDDAGDLLQRQYTGGLTLPYSYDALNRLLTADNVTLTRDAEGRILTTDNPGTVFGAAYDDGGRLASVTYNNSLFAVTYTYDAVTGLLSGVTDSLTNTVITLTYDNDRRLTGITRSNGVNTTYAWDNANRLTGIQDGTVINLQYTLDAAGQITSANTTLPLDPASLLAEGTQSFTYDNASQISAAGYSHDPRGRLTASPSNAFTWDHASRLTGINTAVLAYNGLGDLMTRTESGTAIYYYYNRALGLNPIVAERNDTAGQFLRYYVYTPGGWLLYMIDAADGNKVYHYHFDRTGSALALTGAAGTVTDSYAYTPYGRLLGHNGANQQPFTFVGQWGVRQEGNNNLYHMRTRYYEANTARFINKDSLWPSLGDIREINPYQYALGDPLAYIDPAGTKGFGTELAGELSGLQLINAPTSVWGLVFTLLLGTGTDYQESDFGYGNPQIGFMTREQYEKYLMKLEDERIAELAEKRAAQRKAWKAKLAAEEKEKQEREEKRKKREAFLAAGKALGVDMKILEAGGGIVMGNQAVLLGVAPDPGVVETEGVMGNRETVNKLLIFGLFMVKHNNYGTVYEIYTPDGKSIWFPGGANFSSHETFDWDPNGPVGWRY